MDYELGLHVFEDSGWNYIVYQSNLVDDPTVIVSGVAGDRDEAISLGHNAMLIELQDQRLVYEEEL